MKKFFLALAFALRNEYFYLDVSGPAFAEIDGYDYYKTANYVEFDEDFIAVKDFFAVR